MALDINKLKEYFNNDTNKQNEQISVAILRRAIQKKKTSIIKAFLNLYTDDNKDKNILITHKDGAVEKVMQEESRAIRANSSAGIELLNYGKRKRL